MPEGLLDPLAPGKAADLLAYQGSTDGEEEHKRYTAWDSTGAYLLTFALPLKSLLLTGRKASPVTPLTAAETEDVISAGRDYFTSKKGYEGRSPAQLMEGLSSWSPAVRRRWALGLEKADADPVPGPSGRTVTPESPPDHPHHTGFFAAAEVNGGLYCQGRTRDRIRHLRFVRTEAGSDRATGERSVPGRRPRARASGPSSTTGGRWSSCPWAAGSSTWTGGSSWRRGRISSSRRRPTRAYPSAA
jgi:hypothetical protein